MAAPRFYAMAGPFSVADIAQRIGANLASDADPARTLRDVAPLDEAGPEHLSFLENRRYLDTFAQSRAGACVAEPAYAARAPKGMALLLAGRSRRAYALAAAMFHPEPAPEPGIHPRATVASSAVLAADVALEAGAVIGARVAPASARPASASIGRPRAI